MSASVTIIADAADGGSLVWVTRSTCTLDIASNACSEQHPNVVISGTGHCPDPAAPYRTNPTEPDVMIGDFWFVTIYQSGTVRDQ